jgi:hypothetical protein
VTCNGIMFIQIFVKHTGRAGGNSCWIPLTIKITHFKDKSEGSFIFCQVTVTLDNLVRINQQ